MQTDLRILSLLSLVRAELQRLRSSSMVKDAGWVLIGQGVSFLLQVGYFVLLARVLGVEQYGVFAGAVAFVSLVMPFSNLGAGMLFMRYVSADSNQFARYWGNILLSALIANAVIIFAFQIAAPHLLNLASAALIVPVLIANCLMGQFIQCAVQVFQSYQLMHLASLWSASLNALRFVAAAMFMILIHHATAYQWAWVSALIATLVAITAAIAVTAKFGMPSLDTRLLIQRFNEGMLYSFSSSTASAYNDLDKTILSHYSMNVANGVYTTAYRIVDVASIPVASVEWAALPRFFRGAENGIPYVARQARGILKRVLLIGALAGAVAFVSAPLIPRLLGPGFAESALALRWLCLLPVFRGVHQITGAALTGSGHQRYRTTAQAIIVLINFSLNILWIPTYGWIGAAWASLISDCALGVISWIFLSWLERRHHSVHMAPSAAGPEESR